MKKKVFNIFLTSIGVFSITALTSVSCIDAGILRNNKQYIKNFNEPNFLTTNNFSFNENKYISNDTDALLFSPIINFEYRDKVVLDYINNNVLIPTKKIWRLNLVNFVKINLRDGRSKIYNNDNFDLSLTPPDFANGYRRPILNVLSNDDLSINNPQFQSDLENALNVEIDFKKVEYVNYKGEKTGHFLTADDFLLTFNKKENISRIQEIKNNYGIDLKVNSVNSLVIENTKKMLVNFFKEELTKNMIFNPTSSSYLKSLNKTIDEYKPKLQEAVFLSYYVLNSNEIEKQKYIKNMFAANTRFVNDTNTLTEIVLKFNLLPIDIETYRLQTFKAYRQNLISESEFDIFNSSQQRDIMNFSFAYGLTLQLPISSLTSNVNSLYNSNFSNNKPYDFNNAFSKLIYGSKIEDLLNEERKKYFYQNKESYLFRLYLSNVLNLYTISYSMGFSSYWNNLSLPQTLLTGTDAQFNNYKTLSDASVWVTQNTIPSFDFGKFKSTNSFLERNSSFSIKNILDYQNQLKTSNFDFIKNNIKVLLDDFYSKNTEFSDNKLEFSIPLFSSINDTTNKNANEIEKLINSLDKRLKVKVVLTDSAYTNQYNSFINHFSLSYVNSHINSYIDSVFDNTDLIFALIYTDNINTTTINKLRNVLIETKTKEEFIFEYLNNVEFRQLTRTKILKFFEIRTNFEQVTLFNEISTIFPVPLSLSLLSNDTSFKRIIVQNNLIKPLNDLGFNQFQDIKVF